MLLKHVRFLELCKTFEKVRGTSSKLEKVRLLAKAIRKMDEGEVYGIIRYMLGSDVGVGWSTIAAVIEEATGEEVFEVAVKKGDLGEAAYELLRAGKRILPLDMHELTIMEVVKALDSMAQMKGSGSQVQKKRALLGLMLNSSPLEAKYIVKLLLGELRIGATAGLLEEAVALACGYPHGRVREAVLMLADLAEVARLAKKGRLEEAKPALYRPIGFMLAETAPTPREAMEKFGKPVYAEYKYDGIRAQAHIGPDDVKIFSRRLEEISSSFPEVVEELKELDESVVLDGEILAYRKGRPIRFTELQRRLHRKEVDEWVLREVPVKYFVFDLLMLNGKETMSLPLKKRKELLDEFRDELFIAPWFVVSEAEEVEKLFRESRELGYEGLMLKDPDSVYTPGRRGAKWMKLKRELDTVDAVVVAVEYGHGKRAGLLSDYTFAVWDGDELKVIGKAYSGLTDEELIEMTKYFKERVVEWRGPMAVVRPEVVVEVAFDSVQKSGRHSSGFALRFPRIKAIRWDLSPKDADTLERVRKIYESQRE